MNNINRKYSRTRALGIHNEPVKLSVYYDNSKNRRKIIYNVQCHTMCNQFTWYKAYQS